MQFQHITTLASDTPTETLSRAWGTCQDDAMAAQKGKRPMTIREAGALAELHGMKLEDVIAL
jgi:hypothetical protein